MAKKLKRPIAFIASVAMILSMLLYLPSGVMTDIGFGLAVSAEDATGTTSGEGNTSADTGTTGGTGETPDNTDGTGETPDNTDGTGETPDNTDGTGETPDNTDGTGETPDNTDGTGETPDNTDNGEDSTDEPAAVESESVMLLAEGAADFTPTQPSGEGTEASPYQIGTANELYWFAGLVNGTLDGVTQNKAACAKLTANITVNEGVLDSDGNLNSGSFTSWTPIGNSSNQYKGTFDGQNNTISGLYFDNTSIGNVGLFGYVEKGSIINITVADSYFNGNNNVGGVCGYIFEGTLTECSNTGTVSGSNNVGGVCGKNDDSSKLISCSNTGAVSGSGYRVGGVCGNNFTSSSTLESCTNTGTVSGSDRYVGGVCGSNSGTLKGCTNKGTVSGSSYVGGVCSYNYRNLENCKNEGTVSGTGNYVGGVCDQNKGGTITNCNNTGAVSGTGDYVGGVCGQNTNFNGEGKITGCSNTATVTGSSYVGGVCGENENGTLTGCYNEITGVVSGSSNVGGVCGNNNSTITNCYNTSTVKATSDNANVGGVCGQNTKTIESCYSAGAVKGSGKVGGVCGSNTGTITRSYYNSEDCTNMTAVGGGVADTADVTGKTASEFTSGEVCFLLQGNQQDPIWGQQIGAQQLPVFSGDRVYRSCTATGISYSNTQGSSSHVYNDDGICGCGAYQKAEYDETKNVYKISNKGQLYWFAALVNGNTSADDVTVAVPDADAVLMNDITVNSNVLKADGTLNSGSFTAWTPIGSFSKPYTGTFSGLNGENGNYTIRGLYFNNDGTEYVGLFGYVGDGSIKNVTVADSYFNGKNFVGGVCGYSKNGKITSCNNAGAVSGIGYYIGGVCGSNSGTLTGCNNESTGKVIGKKGETENFVGGVCGINSGTLENCNNKGTVIGSRYKVGGVCGSNSGKLTGCNNESTGEVSGSEKNVGGVCGSNSGTLESCKNTGTVIGTGENVGGVCGDSSGTLTSCNNESTVNGSNNVGGVCGYSSGTLTECSNTATVTGSDNVGGVVGYTESTTIIIKDCYNKGAVSGSGSYVGGVCGYNKYSTVTSCYNTGECTVIGEGDYVGGVCGYNYGGKLTGCYNESTGTVSGVNKVGGVCGDNYTYGNQYATLTSCFNRNTGAISGTGNNVGGVCGDNSGTITSCYNESTVTVTGSSNVGGVCGSNSNTIENCYSTSAVKATATENANVGGICGYNSSSSGVVKYSYTTGAVSGASPIGGMCGKNYGGNVMYCYYNNNAYTGEAVNNENIEEVKDGETTITAAATAFNVEGKATAAFESGEVCYLLQSGQTTQAWGQNLTSDSKDALPKLSTDASIKVFRQCGTGNIVYSNTQGSSGHVYGDDGICSCGAYKAAEFNESDSVYEISNAGQLYWFAALVNGNTSVNGVEAANTNANAVLTKDIIVNNEVLNENGAVIGSSFRFWTPIGSETNKYTGTFDGNGKTISGLYFNDPSTNNVGLFGYVGDGGSIKNINVANSYFNGGSYVGSVCGYNNKGTIENCHNTGKVCGTSSVGGVCGYNFASNGVGKIKGCSNTGAVSGTGDSVGGVCGYNDGYKTVGIEDCHNTGAVSGDSYVGGVCGSNDNPDSTIKGCSNTGPVTSKSTFHSYVGGVCGENDCGIIESCSNTGPVTSNSTYNNNVGGVCGENSGNNEQNGIIRNSFNTGAVSGKHGKIGGVCGYLSGGKIENCYSTGKVTVTVTDINSGYYFGGVCGYRGSGTITRSYYDSEVCTDMTAVGDGVADTADVTGKPTTAFTSGEICYLLNNSRSVGTLVWGQTLSGENQDSVPVFDNTGNKVVYKYCNLGTVYYSNTAQTSNHTDINGNGICACGEYITPALDVETNTYQIKNLGHLYWFAQQVNSGNTGINAELTANITVNSDLLSSLVTDESGAATNGASFRSWTPIGWCDNNTDNAYTGTFNGNGFYVSGLYLFSNDSQNTVIAGLFGVIGNNGNVSNVGVVDSYFYSLACVGGVCGWNNGGTIESCYNTGKVFANGMYAKGGGVCGQNDGIIRNCYNTGAVSGIDCSAVGGVCGSNRGSIANCYYLAETETDSIDGTTAKSATQFGSGEVAYLLQGTQTTDVWGQTIGTDNYPVLGGNKVYQTTPCTSGYSNSTDAKKDHVDENKNGECDDCGGFVDSIGSKVTGHSLTLDGNIGVNFYMELSDTLANDDGAYMLFNLPNGTTETVLVSAATKSGTNYIFSCEVAAKEMTADITAQMFNSSGIGGTVYTYTVKAYADYILNPEYNYPEKTVALVKAMLNYGAYSQVYFDYNTDKPANEGVDVALSTITADTLSEYAASYVKDANYTGNTKYYGSSLMLKSQTYINHYFTYDTSIDISNFTCNDSNGNSYDVAVSGNYLYVRVKNIPAHKLGEELTLTLFENGANVGEIKYSPLSYAYTVLNNYPTAGGENDALRNVVIALYDYYTKAQEFKNNAT